MRFGFLLFFILFSTLSFSQGQKEEYFIDTTSHSFHYLDSAIVRTCGGQSIVPVRKAVFYDSSRRETVDTVFAFQFEEEKLRKDVALVRLVNKIIKDKLPLEALDTLVKQIVPDFGSYKWRTAQMNFTAKTMSIEGNYLKVDLTAIALDNKKRYTKAFLQTTYWIKCKNNWHWGFLEIDPSFFKRYVMPEISVNYNIGDIVLIGDFEAIAHYAKGL